MILEFVGDEAEPIADALEAAVAEWHSLTCFQISFKSTYDCAYFSDIARLSEML